MYSGVQVQRDLLIQWQRVEGRGGAVRFLRHEVDYNSVSSAEAGIGMEGQIVYVEQCTF